MDSDNEAIKEQKIFFLDTNLSSPVLTTELAYAQEVMSSYFKWKTGQQLLSRMRKETREQLVQLVRLCKLNSWRASYMKDLNTLLPHEYPEIEDCMKEKGRKSGLFYPQAGKLTSMLEESLCIGLEERGLSSSEVKGTCQLLQDHRFSNYESSYEQFWNLFARASSRTKHSEHIWTKGVVGSCEIWLNSSIALIRRNNILRLSTLNQILNLKDKLSTRYMLLTHVRPLGLPESLEDRLNELFKWQDDCLRHYGNEAYSILKATEPLFKTWLSHTSDNVFGDDTAYTRMITKMRLKEKELPNFNIHKSYIDDLCIIVEKTTSITEIVEMFGSMKSCGHPIIDPVRGGLSAAAEARSKDTTSLVDAQKLRNTFCHIILSTMIEKGASWPKLKFMRKNLKLEHLYARQSRNISYGAYSIDEWTYIEWTKMFDMDYYPNFLELMDDKSISFYRDEKHLSWDQNSSRQPRSQRRLLLEILRKEKFSVEEIVKRVSARDIPWEWFIVCLFPKEREFKPDARMFAMMVIEMRCFFTCIEANIADQLFKFMPQQTMTLSKTKIQERFLTFTDPARTSDLWTLFLEIDLSRWNLRWRQMVIHLIGHDLNQMFGVKGTFTVTHWFFSLCQVLVRVGGLRPDGVELPYPPESGLAWRDHYGGFEGINQKLWTAATYAMVELALERFLKEGFITRYELIGQGDNQVLRLEIPKTGEERSVLLKRIRDEVNTALEATCRSVNQEVKPEENIESPNVLTYSKDVYVSGVEYPTSNKKHSRLFPVTSMDFPSTAANASAIMSGAVAGAENANKPLRSLIIGWYHTCRYLLSVSAGFSIHGRQSVTLTETQILAAIILPPSIGGMIGTPVASFLYKGGSDPLGKEISSLRLLASSPNTVGQLASRALRGLEEKYCISADPDIDTLIDNPYGLPVDKKAAPVSRVSNLTLEAFKPKVKNLDIKPLLSKASVKEEKVLRREILTVRPLNPLIAHDLYECSGFGTIRTMRKMFLTTRTIQSVAQWVNPNITHMFLRSDRDEQLWFKNWVNGLPKRGYSGKDSFTLVTTFRNYWGVQLHGVTNYQPLDYYHKSGTTRSPSSIKWSSHSAEDLYTTRGPLSGYIGSSTREKRSDYGYKIVDRGDATRSLQKLQLIRSQANGDKNFNRLIDSIGLTRSPCVLSTITDLLEHVRGGSMHHRYAAIIRELGSSFIGPLNFVTHIRLDTDSVEFLSGSVLNYPLMFEEFMTYTMACAKIQNAATGVRSGELILELSGLTPLPDDALTCPEITFSGARMPKSHLVYADDLLLRRTYEAAAMKLPRGSVIGLGDYSTARCGLDAYRGALIDLLRDNHTSKRLAETKGLASVPAKYKLDISESHALGPKRLILGCAEAIIVSILRDVFRILHLHPDRWDEGLFSDFQIDACYKVVGQYTSHPLLSSHRDAHLLRGASLSYSKTMSSQGKFKSQVRAEIMKIYSDLTHPFWTTKLTCFAGQETVTIGETLLVSVAREMLQLYVISHPDRGRLSTIFTSMSYIRNSSEMTTEAQLDVIRARVMRFSRILQKEGMEDLSTKVKRLALMQDIAVYNDDVRTVLRAVRSLEPNIGEIRPVNHSKQPHAMKSSSSICHLCIPPPEDRLHVMWNSYRRRTRGGYSSAGYTWLDILGNMKMMRNCLIVGSGNGGLADLIISSFGSSVIGLDLENDMPASAASLLNYVPIGVQLENSSQYTQSDLSITTSGDWNDSIVRRRFVEECTLHSTLIVDITAELEQGLILETLGLIKMDNIHAVYIRVITHNPELLMKSVEKVHPDITSWCVHRTYSECELIIGIGDHDLHNCNLAGGPLYKGMVSEFDTQIPERKTELMSSALHNVISIESLSLEDMEQKVKTLCERLLNKPRHIQLRYKERINLIEAYLVLWAVNSSDPVSTLQHWIRGEEAETDLFIWSMRRSTETHLIRYVSRLAGLYQRF
jgi:hypothetical protein